MDYEKAYKAVLKTATQWIKDGCTDKEKICLECVFPELRGSEDERIRKEMIAYFAHRADVTEFIDEGEDCKRWISYLEKQKEQKPWSEEDERMLSRCVKSIESSKQFADSDTFKKAKDNEINWLKNRFKSLRPQPKQEWSEDDEKMLEQVVDVVYDYCPDPVAKYKLKDWLNLRFKSLRPSWKPSEEQMDRLFSIVAALRKDYCDDMADFLANLYADIKKLGVKEEPEYYQHFDPDC